MKCVICSAELSLDAERERLRPHICGENLGREKEDRWARMQYERLEEKARPQRPPALAIGESAPKPVRPEIRKPTLRETMRGLRPQRYRD